MRYQPPYGRETEGDSAHYINGNPVEGQRGSIPPAAAFEYPMRELLAIIEKSKITPSDTDLLQVAKGVRSQRMNWAEDTGSVNNLSVALDPPLGEYTRGLVLRVKVYQTNTGAATIDAGAGRTGIIRMNGGSTQAGDLPGGGVCDLVYDGTRFQMTNFLGAGLGGGDITNYTTNIPYAADVSTTANIVDATFTTLDQDPLNPYALKAGDPFLVRINNTNSGASIARFKTPKGSLGDKPILANGGGGASLLQGDMQVGDVMLFIFDGTSFWIQPNPVITGAMQINVPSQYATVDAACVSLRRKTIASTGAVTIFLAKGAGPVTGWNGQPGCYAPFAIDHANAERITVRGEMKIPGNLVASMFFQTGNLVNDSNNNIQMLRSRFGVEVAVPAGPARMGIINGGAGMPTVRDILVTGPNYGSGQPNGAWNGIQNAFNGSRIYVENCTCWGLDTGFVGGGSMTGNYCFSCGNWLHGVLCTAGAQMGFGFSGFFGNQIHGVICNQNSMFGCMYSYANQNGSCGVCATDNGQLTFHTSQAVGNHYIDILADALSYIIVLSPSAGGGFGSISPASGSLSAHGALTMVGPG